MSKVQRLVLDLWSVHISQLEPFAYQNVLKAFKNRKRTLLDLCSLQISAETHHRIIACIHRGIVYICMFLMNILGIEPSYYFNVYQAPSSSNWCIPDLVQKLTYSQTSPDRMHGPIGHVQYSIKCCTVKMYRGSRI